MKLKARATTGLLLVLLVSLAVGGSKSQPTASPEIALLIGSGDLENVIVKKGDTWQALTHFRHPHHIYDFAVSPDGNRAFVWHMDFPPRTVSIYELGGRRLLARFRPGYGGQLRWTAAGTLLHIWGAGTAVRVARLYDQEGRTIFQIHAEAFSVSPSALHLAALPIVPGALQKIAIWDLTQHKIVLESTKEYDIQSVLEAAWRGDGELRVRYEDAESKVHTLTLTIGDSPPPAKRSSRTLNILGQSLFLREGGEDRILLRAVQPAENLPGAKVRRVHSLALAPDGSRAAVLVSLNRQMHLLPVRIGGGGHLEYGGALPVPRATEAIFSPRGDALLLVSTGDTYLPPDNTFRLNRGAMYVRLSEFPWHSGIEAALQEPGEGRWYGRPGSRFVSDGDFEILALRWRKSGCSLKVRDNEGEMRTVTLH